MNAESGPVARSANRPQGGRRVAIAALLAIAGALLLVQPLVFRRTPTAVDGIGPLFDIVALWSVLISFVALIHLGTGDSPVDRLVAIAYLAGTLTPGVIVLGYMLGHDMPELFASRSVPPTIDFAFVLYSVMAAIGSGAYVLFLIVRAVVLLVGFLRMRSLADAASR